MKRWIPIVMLAGLFFLPPGLREGGGDTAGTSLAFARSQALPLDTDQVIDPSRAEEDEFFYDPEIISRKLFQKKLPALSNAGKIMWSFRMADSDPFL